MLDSFRFGFLGLVFAVFLASPAQAISDKYRDLSVRLGLDAEQELLQQKAEAADNF